MAKSIALPKTNLYLLGSGKDTNGNKIVKLHFPNQRGFSLQTGDGLPKTGSALRYKKTYSDMEKLSARDLTTIAKEVSRFLKKHGSPKQKKSLRTY